MATKFAVRSNIITGKNSIFSTHRSKSAAEKACAKACKKGASFVVVQLDR